MDMYSKFDEEQHARDMFCCVRIGVVALVMQALLTLVALLSGAVMYPYLLHTSQSVDALVSDVKGDYAVLDKAAIHEIISHSRNASSTTRQLLQHHGAAIAEDAHKLSSAAVHHTNLLDTIDRMVHLVETPIQEIHTLITHNHSVDLQQSLSQADHVLSKIDTLEINRVTQTLTVFLQKMNDSLNPETLKELKYIVEQFNAFTSDSNKQKMDAIVHDTDESMKHLNRIIHIFSRANVDENV